MKFYLFIYYFIIIILFIIIFLIMERPITILIPKLVSKHEDAEINLSPKYETPPAKEREVKTPTLERIIRTKRLGKVSKDEIKRNLINEFESVNRGKIIRKRVLERDYTGDSTRRNLITAFELENPERACDILNGSLNETIEDLLWNSQSWLLKLTESLEDMIYFIESYDLQNYTDLLSKCYSLYIQIIVDIDKIRDIELR